MLSESVAMLLDMTTSPIVKPSVEFNGSSIHQVHEYNRAPYCGKFCKHTEFSKPMNGDCRTYLFQTNLRVNCQCARSGVVSS